MPIPSPLDLLSEQLWAPLTSTGRLKVVVGRGADPGWTTVERYWMVPDARRARLIVPAGPRLVTRRLLTNYRGLRRPAVNLVRAGLGATAGLGLPSGTAMLKVQIPQHQPATVCELPLQLIGERLGRVHAATGVRSGDNRKATLHLTDGRGEPVGYAKVGWNPTIDQAIEAEKSALEEIDEGSGSVRAPRVLAHIGYAGHPILVTSPLPLDVRPVRPEEVSAQEIHSLMPVVRQDLVTNTSQYRATLARLSALRSQAVVEEIAEQAVDLLHQVDSRSSNWQVPVGSRWHGDLAPWNMARDSDGSLWIWDWESSEPDAVAGLDALHWAASVARLRDEEEPDVSQLLQLSREHFAAAGVPQPARQAIAACYVATIVERAGALAAQAGSWDHARQSPTVLTQLMREARQKLADADPRSST